MNVVNVGKLIYLHLYGKKAKDWDFYMKDYLKV
jgi:hypothetical protein